MTAPAPRPGQGRITEIDHHGHRFRVATQTEPDGTGRFPAPTDTEDLMPPATPPLDSCATARTARKRVIAEWASAAGTTIVCITEPAPDDPEQALTGLWIVYDGMTWIAGVEHRGPVLAAIDYRGGWDAIAESAKEHNRHQATKALAAAFATPAASLRDAGGADLAPWPRTSLAGHRS